MSIKTKIAALALATLAVTGSMASITTTAEAKGLGLGWGIGAGLIGAAVVGSAIAANDGYYYDVDRRCGWVREFPQRSIAEPLTRSEITSAFGA